MKQVWRGMSPRRRGGWLGPMSAQRAVLLLTLYLLLVANWPLWLSLARIGANSSAAFGLIAPMLGLQGAATVAMLAALAWARGVRWLWWLMVAVAAFAQYYMLTYNVAMDRDARQCASDRRARGAGSDFVAHGRCRRRRDAAAHLVAVARAHRGHAMVETAACQRRAAGVGARAGGRHDHPEFTQPGAAHAQPRGSALPDEPRGAAVFHRRGRVRALVQPPACAGQGDRGGGAGAELHP